MVLEKQQVGKCVICKYITQSRGQRKKFRFISADKIIRDKLRQHYEDEHLDTIMQVWMNSEASEGY